ncbi:unnamed protein product, partial [Allacma fusca]
VVASRALADSEIVINRAVARLENKSDPNSIMKEKGPLKKKLSKRDSYTFLNPQVPAIINAVGSTQGGVGSPVRRQRLEEESSDTDESCAGDRTFLIQGKSEKSGDLLGDLKKELETDYHKISLEVLLRKFGSNVSTGLSQNQADINMGRFGPNVLTPPDDVSDWMLFLEHLTGGFSVLLWVGAFLCFGAFAVQKAYLEDAPSDYLYLGIVLSLVVLISGTFAYYQEAKSSRIMDSFKKMVPQCAVVLREGNLFEIDATDLVVGDIVHMKLGDKIPADVRLIESDGFKVDNSALTGESEPQSRNATCTHDNPLETKNLCFFSTNALEGTAKGLVISVGDSTLMGRIAGLATKLEVEETPMAQEMAHF